MNFSIYIWVCEMKRGVFFSAIACNLPSFERISVCFVFVCGKTSGREWKKESMKKKQKWQTSGSRLSYG